MNNHGSQAIKGVNISKKNLRWININKLLEFIYRWVQPRMFKNDHLKFKLYFKIKIKKKFNLFILCLNFAGIWIQRVLKFKKVDKQKLIMPLNKFLEKIKSFLSYSLSDRVQYNSKTLRCNMVKKNLHLIQIFLITDKKVINRVSSAINFRTHPFIFACTNVISALRIWVGLIKVYKLFINFENFITKIWID